VFFNSTLIARNSESPTFSSVCGVGFFAALRMTRSFLVLMTRVFGGENASEPGEDLHPTLRKGAKDGAPGLWWLKEGEQATATANAWVSSLRSE